MIDTRRDKAGPRITNITGSGVDYVVETTGDPTMYRLSMDVLNPHGTAAFLTGISGPASLPERRTTLSIIQGDAVPQHFIPKLIALYRAGQFPYDSLLKFYNFSEINKAIDDSRRGDTIKPVLRISGSEAREK